MNYALVNGPSAKVDIKHAVFYYKNISGELAEKFLLRIDEAKDIIARSPIAYQVKYKNVRVVSLKQFPYQIHYITDERKRRVIILAIIHAYRKPDDYSNR